MAFSNIIESTIEALFYHWIVQWWYFHIPLRVPFKQCFIIEWPNGIEWYH